MYDSMSVIKEVDINEILPNRFQPRIQFDEEEILELSESIKEHGVIQPLVVRTIGDKYEIIAGERRYKASVLAGKETVPIIVRNLNDKDSAEIALIENIQRKNLTPIEEALSYKKILDMGYITQENLASKLGKSQSSVANKIRLLNLPDEVQEALLENKISERHARSLLKLATTKQQNEMLNRIINERLTVRRTDEEIEKIKNESINKINKEKQIEKGEINMNNNMYGIPNVPPTAQSSSNFDIFGTPNPQPVVDPVVTNINPITSEIPSMNQTPSGFDIFGGTAPVIQPSQPEMATMSAMDSMPSVQQAVPVIETPVVEPTPIVPPMNEMQFNTNGITVEPSQPEIPIMPAMDSMPSVQPVVEPVIPQTAPIIEQTISDDPIQINQQSENLFSFGNINNVNTELPTSQPEIPTMPEFKMPEPIIVTDYSKQYDPIMPQTPENIIPTVDFKEVINIIRECSNKIEQYGFKIDVEEYDLSNLYQVIFKIEK